MRANQRLIASDGYEVMLFPMEYMNISQGEYSSYSHELAMDFLGWNASGRVYNCPYYAPCSCRCVAHWGSSDNATWESLDKVHLPDGSLTKVTFCFNHDPLPPAVGTVLTQGDLIGHSGRAGFATGDHMHFNTAIGDYDGYSIISGTQYYQLTNSSHIYNTCYVNDTVIIDGYGYNWVEYTAPPTPPSPERRKFPWVLYANKLRNRANV